SAAFRPSAANPVPAPRQVIEKELIDKGFSPDFFQVVMTVDNPEAIKDLVALGTGIAFISALSIRPEDAGRIRIVPVEDFQPVRDLWVFIPRRKLSPAADFFIETLFRTVRERRQGD
ncbi:MAG: 'Transcriptional regulator, LysR family, partial [Leptospirillum sp. Group IV 'UBA BS']